jgi:hypothetical protein
MNGRSVLKNLNEIKLFVASFKPKMLFISEARVTNEINDAEIEISNYRVYRCDSFTRRTGGVIVYVQVRINCEIISSVNRGYSWFMALKVIQGYNKGIYGVLYKSPKEKDNIFLQYFEEWCDSIILTHRLNLIMGDFNINVKVKDKTCKELLELGKKYKLKQIIDKYTRETLNSKSIIDLVFTNIKEIKFFVDNVNLISDHNIIGINLLNDNKKNNNEHDIKKQTCWKNYSQNKLIEMLFDCDWNFFNSCDDVDSKAKCLINFVETSVNRLVYPILIKNKHRVPWFNSDLRSQKNECQTLKNECNIDKSELAWSNYKIKRNDYKNNLRKAEMSYIYNEIESNRKNSTKLWQTLTNLYNKKDNIIKNVYFNDTELHDDCEIAENFNSFFIESIEKITSDIDKTSSGKSFLDNIIKSKISFKFTAVNISTLKKIMKLNKNKKFYNNINGNVLYDAFCNPVFAVEFCNLMNDSLLTGKFPDSWKISTVVPIKKIKNAKNCDEFRPINMLPIYEKAAEMVVIEQLKYFLKENKILTSHQSGFRETYSCETALNFVIDEWSNSVSMQKYVVCVFLDFKRAFETVNRKLLLEKMSRYGFEGSTVNWFKDYLSNRMQNTKINNYISSHKKCDIGVPQGSVLGPLLFVLYINDIVSAVDFVKIRLFADDTLLYVECNNVNDGIDKINHDLVNIMDWLNYNSLALNVKKTKAMIISRKDVRAEKQIKVDNDQIEIVNEFSYLGVLIDSKLSFINYSNYIVRKMTMKFHMLNRLSAKFSNVPILCMLYKTLIQPHIDFCATILFMLSDSQLRKLQKVQNKVMRLILKADRLTPVNKMLDELNWLSVKERITFNTLKFIYKIENDQAPKYLKEKLTTRGEKINYNLRNRHQYNVPSFTKGYNQSGLFYKGIQLFNNFKLTNEYSGFEDFKRKCLLFVINLCRSEENTVTRDDHHHDRET